MRQEAAILYPHQSRSMKWMGWAIALNWLWDTKGPLYPFWYSLGSWWISCFPIVIKPITLNPVTNLEFIKHRYHRQLLVGMSWWIPTASQHQWRIKSPLSLPLVRWRSHWSFYLIVEIGARASTFTFLFKEPEKPWYAACQNQKL